MLNPIVALLATSNIPFGYFPQQRFDLTWYINVGTIQHFIPEFGSFVDALAYTWAKHAMVDNGKSINILIFATKKKKKNSCHSKSDVKTLPCRPRN